MVNAERVFREDGNSSAVGFVCRVGIWCPWRLAWCAGPSLRRVPINLLLRTLGGLPLLLSLYLRPPMRLAGVARHLILVGCLIPRLLFAVPGSVPASPRPAQLFVADSPKRLLFAPPLTLEFKAAATPFFNSAA